MTPNATGKFLGHCRLCGEARKLCKAYLLPNALRKVVVDFPADKSMQAVHTDLRRTYPVQTLRFDANILCAKCDAELGPFDRDFADILKEWVFHPARRHAFWPWGIDTYCHLNGTPEHLFHGALTSLLRFSYSQQFPAIDLGCDSAQAIARLIRGRTPLHSSSHSFEMRLIGSFAYVGNGVDLT
ncbi:MAG: hypothetical protein ACT6U0_17585, partial [Shinella sp.]